MSPDHFSTRIHCRALTCGHGYSAHVNSVMMICAVIVQKNTNVEQNSKNMKDFACFCTKCPTSLKIWTSTSWANGTNEQMSMFIFVLSISESQLQLSHLPEVKFPVLFFRKICIYCIYMVYYGCNAYITVISCTETSFETKCDISIGTIRWILRTITKPQHGRSQNICSLQQLSHGQM